MLTPFLKMTWNLRLLGFQQRALSPVPTCPSCLSLGSVHPFPLGKGVRSFPTDWIKSRILTLPNLIVNIRNPTPPSLTKVGTYWLISSKDRKGKRSSASETQIPQTQMSPGPALHPDTLTFQTTLAMMLEPWVRNPGFHFHGPITTLLVSTAP